MRTTSVYERNAAAWIARAQGVRRACNQGGTSSSKTFSILQLLVLICRHAKSPMLVTVVSESLPHLKRGCIRDFFLILGEQQDNNPCYNKTDCIYTFSNGAKVEFMGMDEPGKERGPRRQVLFLNEANNIRWEIVQGLDIRTDWFTFADWNPTAEFWIHEHWLGQAENSFIHSTYLDARDVLPREVVANIESNKDKDPNWWRIYGEGQLGVLEHIIWKNWEIVQDLPPQCDWKYWAYGLDFGFTNPSALVKVVMSGDKLYWDEVFYQPGLTNSDVIERLSHQDRADVYADSAEPDRITEIGRAGWNVFPANKDVKMGLDVVRRQKLCITKRSVAAIKEIRNYSYKKDRDGHVLEEPVKIQDHICDAGRYATLGIVERYGSAVASGKRNTNYKTLTFSGKRRRHVYSMGG